MLLEAAIDDLSGNKDLDPFIPIVLESLQDFNKVPLSIEQLAGCIFVQNIEYPALAVISPILKKGLRNDNTEIKRKSCVIIDNMCKLVKDPKEIYPLYDILKPLIEGCVDKISDPEAIITSSTSSFLPEEFQLSSTRRKKILLTHYINPPYIIPLVEIVPGNDTADKTIYEVYDLLKSINKKPVILNQPIPGFISVRLQVALLREALYLIDNNLANAKQIDDVIKFSIGRRWAISGLLKTLDLGGWDIQSSIYDTLASKLSNSINTPNILNTKIKEKKLGVKSQEGFYKWTKEEINEIKTNIAKISYYIDNL